MNTAPVVVDASVMVRWALGGDPDEVDRADRFVEKHLGRMVAPSIFLTEVLGRISGQAKASGPERLAEERALILVERIWELGVDLFPPDPHNDSAQLLALGQNLSIPDAAYVLLAERLETVVYTFDRRLIAGAQALGLGRLAALPE